MLSSSQISLMKWTRTSLKVSGVFNKIAMENVLSFATIPGLDTLLTMNLEQITLVAYTLEMGLRMRI